MKSGAQWQRGPPLHSSAPTMRTKVEVSAHAQKLLCHGVGYELNNIPVTFASDAPPIGLAVGVHYDRLTDFNAASTTRVTRKLTEPTHEHLGEVILAMLSDPMKARDMVLNAPSAVRAQYGVLLAARLEHRSKDLSDEEKKLYALPERFAEAQAEHASAGPHRRGQKVEGPHLVKCEPVVVTGLAPLSQKEYNHVAALYEKVYGGMPMAGVLGTINGIIKNRHLTAEAIAAKMGMPAEVAVDPAQTVAAQSPYAAGSFPQLVGGSGASTGSSVTQSTPPAPTPGKRAYPVDPMWTVSSKKPAP